MDDEKLIALLQAMESRLLTKLKEETAGQDEFVTKAFAQMAQKLAVQIQNVRDEVGQLREDMNLRFEQIDLRLRTADSNWKLGTRWMVKSEDHRVGSDDIVTGLLRDVTDLKERVRSLEQKHQSS